MKPKKKYFFSILLPLILFIIAFTWKLFPALQRDISMDEPHTIFHAQESIIKIIRLSLEKEPTPPLFTIIIHFWIKLFGISALSVRTIPILFNALTAVYLYFTGKKFFNVWSGIIAAGLFILSTLHFYFGTDTRTYSLLSMTTAFSLYYFLSLVKNPENKLYLFGLIVSNLVLIYSHYLGCFVILVQVVSSLLYIRDKQIFKKVWISIISTGILYLPMIQVLIKHFVKISQTTLAVATPVKIYYFYLLRIFMNSKMGFEILLYILAAGVIVAFLIRTNIKPWKETTVILLWWLLPSLIMFFASSKMMLYTNRYVLFTTIGFYSSIGALIFFFFQKLRFSMPVLTVVLLVTMGLRMNTGNLIQRNIKDVSNYVEANAINDMAIYIYPQWSNLGFSYYYCPDIFKQTENYYSVLNDHNIFPLWGLKGFKSKLKKNSHERIIYYQDNKFNSEMKEIFLLLETNYSRTDSVQFSGGQMVCIFDRK